MKQIINGVEVEVADFPDYAYNYAYCGGPHGRGHVGHNDDAWETKAIAWDTKENASYEAFQLAMAEKPYYYQHLGEEIALAVAKLDLRGEKLDNALALAQVSNEAKSIGVEDRKDARASQALEIRELAALQYLDSSKFLDVSGINSFNQLLREQTWAANDWIETALRNNVDLARTVTAAVMEAYSKVAS
jgi:hypothetical protein